MRHDDSTHNSHRLFQLNRPAAFTVRYKHPLQQLPLVWLHKHILQRGNTVKDVKGPCTYFNVSVVKKHLNYIGIHGRALYLITKTDGHYSDEKGKESFKFPQAYRDIKKTASTLAFTDWWLCFYICRGESHTIFV